jgi:hypothetical protein
MDVYLAAQHLQRGVGTHTPKTEAAASAAVTDRRPSRNRTLEVSSIQKDVANL